LITADTHVLDTATQRLKKKQELAKAGMTASLAITTVSGFMRGRRARRVHVWAGVALIGFSFWHHRLYRDDMLEREINAASKSQKERSG
jgi:hypothetical protein